MFGDAMTTQPGHCELTVTSCKSQPCSKYNNDFVATGTAVYTSVQRLESNPGMRKELSAAFADWTSKEISSGRCWCHC